MAREAAIKPSLCMRNETVIPGEVITAENNIDN